MKPTLLELGFQPHKSKSKFPERARPHAPAAAGAFTFAYDANGNLTAGDVGLGVTAGPG